MEERAFTGSVFGVNLDLWRQKEIHSHVLYWLQQVSDICTLTSHVA